MSIKVTFPVGSNAETVRGLYQWDYGQILEIESVDLGSEIVEVHFACSNMNEAIVRSCTFTDGVGSVTIPDACLEQSTPVTAWIYEISGTQGHTLKTITLPISARIRPSVSRDIPAAVSDRYTELITEVNNAINDLESGNVTVAKATDAVNASHAVSAGNAATANYAASAGNANTAGVAQQLSPTSISYDVSSGGIVLNAKIKPGKCYIISAYSSLTSWDGELRETMFLYCPVGLTSSFTYVCSTKSAGDHYVQCSYDADGDASIELRGADGSGYIPRHDGKIHLLEF